MEFLKELGYTRQSVRLHQDQLNENAAVIVAAALLRETNQDSQFDILKLQSWLRQHGVHDVTDFVQHISGMIQAMQQAAQATAQAA